jgi:hypothetical protein
MLLPLLFYKRKFLQRKRKICETAIKCPNFSLTKYFAHFKILHHNWKRFQVHAKVAFLEDAPAACREHGRSAPSIALISE